MIKSSIQDFPPSKIPFWLVVIKKHGYNYEKIKQEINNYNDSSKQITSTIFQIVEIIQSDSEYNILYKYFEDWDYLYIYFFRSF